jgi:hypothetical protein
MKKLLYTLLFIAFAAAAEAGMHKTIKDSITDSWSFTINGKEIPAFTIDGISTYLVDSIADSDKIIIDYYTQQPCTKCQCRLQLKDENGKMLAMIQKNGFGEGEPFRLPGRQFRQLMHNHKMFLYFSANPDGWGTWVFLGMVKTGK